MIPEIFFLRDNRFVVSTYLFTLVGSPDGTGDEDTDGEEHMEESHHKNGHHHPKGSLVVVGLFIQATPGIVK